MNYQDSWSRGRCIASGYRECSSRYEIVRKFCSERFGSEAFTVLDVGANMCYFGIRLTEDFGNCSVMAFEFDHFESREKHLAASGASRVLLLNRRLSISDLRLLSNMVRFDMVLAMSIAHHLPGDTDAWLDSMLCVGRCVVMEFAGEDSKRTSRKGFHVPSGGLTLGYGDSHLLDGHRRPIMVYE